MHTVGLRTTCNSEGMRGTDCYSVHLAVCFLPPASHLDVMRMLPMHFLKSLESFSILLSLLVRVHTSLAQSQVDFFVRS